ncbi:MAG: glycosyltransferase family 4 protein [Thermoleophilia bacterium]
MKILICSPVIPSPATSGLKIRVLNLAKHLARNNEVHLFCLSETPATPRQQRSIDEAGLGLTVVSKPANAFAGKLATYARRMAGLTPPEFILSWEQDIFAALKRLDREGGYDVAIAEHLFMARYTAAMSCPRVMVLHNIESDLARQLAATYAQPRRAYKRLAAAWARNYERRMLALMQGGVTVSSEDREMLAAMAPGLPSVVVENGVDCGSFSATAAAERPGGHRLLYLGLMSYESNIDAVTWFADAVLPLIRRDYPETTFTVAGGDPAAAVLALSDREGVAVTGFVDEVEPLYREHDILVVPLRHGGGSRLKVLEAFAAGTPVVATTKGAEGLAVEDGRHLLIADDPVAMAAAVVRLYREPETAVAIRSGALRLVAERYDWPLLADKLAVFLEAVAGGADA